MKFTPIIGLILSLAVSGSVNANWTLAVNYLKNQNTELYLAAAQTAFLATNAELTINGRQPLFCPSSQLPFTSDGAVAIFELELERWRADGKTSDPRWQQIQLVNILLSGLQRTFPCNP